MAAPVAPEARQIALFLSSLEDRIREQIDYEYHDDDAREARFNSLTVPELLGMLGYMFGDEREA